MSAINIEITGKPGSGKTLMLTLIGSLLKKWGFNVHCEDDFRAVPADKLHEVGPAECPDSREIIVRTK